MARKWSKLRGMSTGLAVGLAALLGGSEAKGDIIPINEVSDYVPRADVSKSYRTEDYKIQGETLMIVWGVKHREGVGYTLVGGLKNNPNDPDIPITTANGFMNQDDAYQWGLNSGEVVDGFIGAIDFNGDGDVGTLDTSTWVATWDEGEYIGDMGKWEHSGFMPFGQNGDERHTIDSINYIPEGEDLGKIAMAVGLAGIGLSRRRKRKDLIDLPPADYKVS